MKNIDMTKVEKVSNGSDLLVNATMNANKFIENVWNQHEVNDEIAERAENAKNIVQNLLGNYMISFDSEDSEVLDCIRAYYDRMDDLVHDEQNLTAFLDMPRDFEILTTLMKETSPAVTTLGLTYLTSAVMQYFDVEDLPAWPEGMSRHDLMMQSIAGLSRELLYVPEFKNSLIRELGVSAETVNSRIIEIQDLSIKSAKSTCYLAASFGLGVASTFEKAFNALQVPILISGGEQDKIQEILLNSKTNQWQEALEENWDEAELNKVLGESVKQFGETATVVGLSLLASSGALENVPYLSAAITAIVLLESIGSSYVHTVENNREIDYRDVLATCGTAAATFAVSKLVPIVNSKLMEKAPKVAELVAKSGVVQVDDLAKITGTIVKVGLGAVDSTMFQTVSVGSKLLRYSLGLEENIDIREELKNCGITIATGAALSGTVYYLKENIRDSEIVADLVKKFTGHEYIAKYDEFGKIAASEISDTGGGSYKDVKKTTTQSGKEVHHTPADSSNDLKRDDGPAIRMDAADHRRTASCGNSKEAREYIARQKALIEQGNWKDAIQMDIDDIRSKFDHKYENELKQMLAYAESMKLGGM